MSLTVPEDLPIVSPEQSVVTDDSVDANDSVDTDDPVVESTQDATSPSSPSSLSDKDSPSEDTVGHDDNLRCPIHGEDTKCKERGLGAKQREEITATLVGPIKISFGNTSAALRSKTKGYSNMLPSFFYRTFYETSITLSSRVSKDTHVKHRENRNLKIRKGNAFQAVANVDLRRDLTKPRIVRHLIWNKKRDPSSWISVFNDLSHAVRRASFHYSDSQRIGHRVSIAEISTRGLIPATLSGTCETTWKVFTKATLGESLKSTVTRCPVDIPIWISSSARPEDGSSISDDEYQASGAELWMSITELRVSNLNNQPQGHDRRRSIFANGHHYEWLAFGRIPESRITRVMPFDGDKLHENPGPATIFSKYSAEPWIYDRNTQTWRLDPILFAQAKYPDLNLKSSKSRKRLRVDDADDTQSDDPSQVTKPQVLSLSSIITTAYCFI